MKFKKNRNKCLKLKPKYPNRYLKRKTKIDIGNRCNQPNINFGIFILKSETANCEIDTVINRKPNTDILKKLKNCMFLVSVFLSI